MVSYNVGFIVTTLAMSLTGKPQPALLYLLPTMVVFYLGAAFIRKETIRMIKYDEDREIALVEL